MVSFKQLLAISHPQLCGKCMLTTINTTINTVLALFIADGSKIAYLDYNLHLKAGYNRKLIFGIHTQCKEAQALNGTLSL